MLFYWLYYEAMHSKSLHLQFQEIFIPTPRKQKFQGGEGLNRLQKGLKKDKLELPEGEVLQTKKHSNRRGMGIFWNNTIETSEMHLFISQNSVDGELRWEIRGPGSYIIASSSLSPRGTFSESL